jgi:hypothetical protein
VYQVAVYAMDTEENVSLPKETYVDQEVGPDLYEDDDSAAKAWVIVVDHKDAQRHNFHDEGDEDWVKFYGVANETYEIKTLKLGSNADTVISVYGENGTTLVAGPRDLKGLGEEESLSWKCLVDGVYYVKVTQSEPGVYGENTGYDLRVYRPTAGDYPGQIYGRISNAQGDGVDGATLRLSNVDNTAITHNGGIYLICQVPPGAYTVTVEADGYETQNQPVTVGDIGFVNVPFSLSPSLPEGKKGDMNKDNNVDLADLIIVLKVLSGHNTTGLIRNDYAASGADVNGDNKVGMQEAICILQKLSGLR